MSRRAYEMAQRGMLFAARQELVQALQLVAQAHDVHNRSGSHAAALAAALTALKEADDFAQAPGRGGPTDVATIARGHRTSLVQGTRDLPPVVAQQQYFNFAQQQLAAAAGREPAASQALYTLGKIQMALASQSSQWQSLDGPRALIYFQAALAHVEQHGGGDGDAREREHRAEGMAAQTLEAPDQAGHALPQSTIGLVQTSRHAATAPAASPSSSDRQTLKSTIRSVIREKISSVSKNLR
jgi:hypothetical protein